MLYKRRTILLKKTLRLLPAVVDNQFRGIKLSQYAFLLITVVTIVRSLIHVFAPDGGAHLVALPGQKIEDLVEVHSHPMAILQCQRFFDDYPNIRLVDSIDTAISAKNIVDKQLKNIGAISSKLAANQYGLEVLADGIETNKMNYTRFLIVTDADKVRRKQQVVNKASITFAVHHEIGSLSKILSILSFYNINLSKIQSIPIIGRDWEYQFYIDVLFDDHYRYRQSLDAIRPFATDFAVLGEYEKGETVFE